MGDNIWFFLSSLTALYWNFLVSMDEVESGKHEGGVQVHIIYAVFLCSEWYIELHEMQIQSLALVKPGGTH